MYIFHYATGSYIPKHKDPAKYGKQYRFNIVLWKPEKGGKFWCRGKHFNFRDRIIIFRADRDYHGVKKIEEGRRIMLSIGIYI